MKFKIKITENTSLGDIKEELEKLKKINVNEIPLNHIRKIIVFLGAEEIQATGSSIRFYHEILKDQPFYRGYFQIHKVHKGGNKDMIRKVDFVKYLYPVLVLIIELKQ
jgi:hypothetical protein